MTDKPVPVTSADTALVGDLLVASHIVTGQAGKMPAGWTLVAIARRIHAPVASADAVSDWQRDPRWWNVLERPVNPWEWDAIEAAIRDTAALDVAYRERNAVVAALIRTHPEWPCWLRTAPDADGWWIVYAETPEGQVSWHFGPNDLDLFGGLENANGEAWDQHTTEEKYRRLARLSQPSSSETEPTDE